VKIAVINSGSSSLKFKLFDMQDECVLFEMALEEIDTNHAGALGVILDSLEEKGISINSIDAVGHRVVHGGEDFSSATLIDNDVIKKIDSLSSLAPLHNPANLQAILAIRQISPALNQYAIFDTAFHATMPPEAYLYAIPLEMYEKHKIRRYGFHGTSHSYIAKECAIQLGKNLNNLNIISLHLGNGASVCAIKNGVSIDTSMGFTPLEGLMMGTRSGDIDPAIVLYMQEELLMSVDEVRTMLNKNSGLKAIANESDLRKILDADDEKAHLAIAMMLRRVRKYIGAYATLFENLDAVVFTGGIGENSEYIRNESIKGLNIKNIMVIKANEELEIARQINI